MKNWMSSYSIFVLRLMRTAVLLAVLYRGVWDSISLTSVSFGRQIVGGKISQVTLVVLLQVLDTDLW